MGLRKAKFKLADLDAQEVSLVPKAANKRKFLLLKMDDAVDKQEKPSKSEGGKKFFASDYAYVPDRNKPSTWKLRLTNTPGGAPDTRIVGAAVAALGKGFRGQKVQIPAADLPGVKAKVRAAWLKANPDKTREDLPEVIKKSDEEIFEEEVLRAELRDLIEKENLVENLQALLADSVNKQEEVTPESVEEEEMAEEVTKKAQATKSAEATEEKEEELVAKREDMPEEEEDEKKMPAFLREKKKKQKTAKEDLDLSTLPEEVRANVEAIYKEHEDIRKEAEELKRLQKQAKEELEAERDARKLEKAIAKAAEEYSNLPVEDKELGALLKTAEENFSTEEYETFTRVLKAADEAVQARKDFEEAQAGTEHTLGTGGALSRLKEIAKTLVEKGDKNMTEAMAFAKAAELNPALYDEYRNEQRG